MLAFLGTEICTLKLESRFSKPFPMHLPSTGPLPFFTGLTVSRTAYGSTEQIKDCKNKLLFKMEMCMNLSDTQDEEFFTKIGNICNSVLTLSTEHLSVLSSASFIGQVLLD